MRFTPAASTLALTLLSLSAALSGCAQQGAGALPPGPNQTIFVTDGSAASQVQIFRLPDDQPQVLIPPKPAFQGSSFVDSSGVLFLAPSIDNPVLEYVPPYTQGPKFIAVPHGFATFGLTGRAPGPLVLRGATSPGLPSDLLIYSFPYGQTAPRKVSLPLTAQTVSIGSGGTIYVAECCTGKGTGTMLLVMRPPYDRPRFRVENIPGVVLQIYADSRGNLLLTDANRRLYGLTPPYRQPLQNLSMTPYSPISTAMDSKGNLFVGNPFGTQIAVYAPPYTHSSSRIDLDLPSATTITQLRFGRGDMLFVLAERGLGAYATQTYSVSAYGPPYRSPYWSSGVRSDPKDTPPTGFDAYPYDSETPSLEFPLLGL